MFEEALLTLISLESEKVRLYHNGTTRKIDCGKPKYEDKLDFFVNGGEGYYYELEHFTNCIQLIQSSEVISIESVIQTLEIIEWEIKEGAK